jgi:hypothetical protein
MNGAETLNKGSKENDLYLYKVISDVGNKYLYVLVLLSLILITRGFILSINSTNLTTIKSEREIQVLIYIYS